MQDYIVPIGLLMLSGGSIFIIHFFGLYKKDFHLYMIVRIIDLFFILFFLTILIVYLSLVISNL